MSADPADPGRGIGIPPPAARVAERSPSGWEQVSEHGQARKIPALAPPNQPLLEVYAIEGQQL